MIFEARNVSRRWSRWTFVAKRVRYVASSKAVSPPPTTAISRSRKKKPSQVAQAETPRPRSRVSLSRPSHSADAPVATMTDWARYSVPRAQIRNGRSGEVDPVDVDVDDPRPEPLGLGAERGHQVGALDAVREARVVLDVAGEHQLAAGRGAGEDHRLEVGPGGVDRGGQAGRPGSDDHDLGLDPAVAALVNGRWAAGPATASAVGVDHRDARSPPKGFVLS